MARLSANAYRLTVSTAWIALIGLCIAWETILAPLRPGGSWLMLKAVPLLFAVFGLLRGNRYTYQWASLFILMYFAEGLVRAWTDALPSRACAIAEIALSLIIFVGVIGFVRATSASAATSANEGSAASEKIRSQPESN